MHRPRGRPLIREPQSEGQARAQCLHLLTQLGYEAVAEPLGPELCDFKRLDRALRPVRDTFELQRAFDLAARGLREATASVVVAGVYGQHGLALPVLALRGLLVPLLLQALLIADGDRDLLLGLDELGLHVDEDLVEHLLGVFCLRDQIVQVRLQQRP